AGAAGTKITFVIDEGTRMAVSGVRVDGNQRIGDREIVSAMQTKPEGFFWWKKGEFDDNKYASDLTEKIPQTYGRHGFIDMQLVRDTLIVERARVGKDSTPTVNLRWDIEEKSPAIVNRVEIFGNDRTIEACIREQIMVVPGDVFNRDLMIRSYQNVSQMGFFDTPVPQPDIRN